MKKTLVAVLIGMAFTGANAASMDDITISGFGSAAFGKANNDVGYAGYDSNNINVLNDTLIGVQVEANINEKAKFVGQVVANGLYDYDLSIEMAYFSYELDLFTVRAGKLRAPLFMYSDYLDVGYAYTSLRPSVELYDNFKINSYTGVELLIPIEFEDSSLLIQPLIGTSGIADRDSDIGEVVLNEFLGAAVHWYVSDFTLRASYVQATSDVSDANYALFDEKDGQFTSLGIQYDNSNMLAVVEATDVRLDGAFSDVQSVSGLLGYRFGSFMPYITGNWTKTSDDEERLGFGGALDDLNYKSTAYSLGSRWDFAQNMAFKVDVTYADFHGTSGGIDATEDDTIVYSAAVDFIF